MSSSSAQSVKIVENIQRIRQVIETCCAQYHRDSASVGLLAVSKTRPAEDIRAAFQAGQRSFGENYLQEALEKIQQLDELDIEWHFIGSIQSNKTREIAQHFSWVHSVDRLKIAQRLSSQRPESMPPLNICLQLNVSNESSKAGMSLETLEQIIDEVMELPALNIRGLMAIPAATDSFEQQRSSFAVMHNTLSKLQQSYPQLDTLSMGMSNDIEAAIAEGSTLLRIGSAIFGARNT